MPLLSEFQNYFQVKPTDDAKSILFAVMDNLLDRRGFRQEWYQIDDDVKEELLETNLQIVRENLPV